MKKKHLLAVLSMCFGAPAGFRTANAAAASESEAPVDTSEIGLLSRGADVDPDDVRWRVAAGLDPKQAVEVALSQKQARAVEDSAKEKKGGK